MNAARVLLLLAFAAAAAAQETVATYHAATPPAQHPSRIAPAPAMTLDEMEALALRNSPEIKLAARRVALAESQVGPAGTLEDPSFTYRGWGVPLRRPWDANRAQNMFMVSQALPGAGKRGLQKEIARQDVGTARAQLEARKREVAAQLRLAYFDLLRIRHELRLHEEHLALGRQAAESARVKYTVGKVPQQDVLRAQIAVTRLLEHIVNFETEAALARARLNTWMGRSPDAPLEVSGEYRAPLEVPSVPELQALAVEHRPELAAARSSIRREELAVALARKAYTPDVMVGGGFMLMPAGEPNRSAYMAEVSVSLPWLNRRRHEADIAQASAAASLQLSEYENTRAAVFREIQEAAVRAQAALRLASLYRDTLRPQAAATLKSAQAAYQTDRADFLSLLDSQAMLLDVELSYNRALSDLEKSLAELELAVGTSVLPARLTAQKEVRP